MPVNNVDGNTPITILFAEIADPMSIKPMTKPIMKAPFLWNRK
jgi:hypothetical protein